MADQMTLAMVLRAYDKASPTIAAVEASLDRFGTKVDRVSAAVEATSSRFATSFGVMRTAGIGLVGAGVAIDAAFAGSVYSAMRVGREYERVAEKTGISASTLSAMGYAAERLEVPFESMQGGLAKMSRAAWEATQGNKDAQESFKQLGVSVTDSTGKLKDPRELFLELADGLSKIQSPTQRMALAMKVFSRSGADMLPMLGQGRAEIERLMVQAEKFGLVWKDSAVAGADEMNDSLEDLRKSLAVVGKGIGAAFFGDISNLSIKASEAAGNFVRWTEAHQGLTKGLTISALAVGLLMKGLGSLLLVTPGLIMGYHAIGAAIGRKTAATLKDTAATVAAANADKAWLAQRAAGFAAITGVRSGGAAVGGAGAATGAATTAATGGVLSSIMLYLPAIAAVVVTAVWGFLAIRGMYADLRKDAMGKDLDAMTEAERKAYFEKKGEDVRQEARRRRAEEAQAAEDEWTRGPEAAMMRTKLQAAGTLSAQEIEDTLVQWKKANDAERQASAIKLASGQQAIEDEKKAADEEKRRIQESLARTRELSGLYATYYDNLAEYYTLQKDTLAAAQAKELARQQKLAGELTGVTDPEVIRMKTLLSQQQAYTSAMAEAEKTQTDLNAAMREATGEFRKAQASMFYSSIAPGSEHGPLAWRILNFRAQMSGMVGRLMGQAPMGNAMSRPTPRMRLDLNLTASGLTPEGARALARDQEFLRALTAGLSDRWRYAPAQ